MANEFYIRKGLSIASASVATASGASQSTKYLVIGDDSIVRWATASTGGGGGTGTSGTSGTRGTSGTSGKAGTSGTRGTSGTSGTSGNTPIQGASYKFDGTTTYNVILSAGSFGGFSYWQETPTTNTIIPANGNLSLVNKIQITKSSQESQYMWDWFKSFNGTGGGTYLYTSVFGYSSTAPTPNVPYSYSSTLTKGYLRVRSTIDSTYNIFKVVGMGYYSPSGGGLPVVFSSMTAATGGYYLAALDNIADNGGTDALSGIVNIYVDYVGSTTQATPSDNEDCFIDFSTSLANLYNQVIVANPAYSFQINDGQNPANLDAFGLAVNSRNSIHINNFTRNILGFTGSRDTTVLGYNAGMLLQQTSYANTFIGASAGAATRTGYANTFIGTLAGRSNVSGHNNVFIGESAGLNNVEDTNVFIGSGSGLKNVSGCGNIFIGIASGAGVTYSHESVMIGVNAGIFADKSEHSVFVGAYAGASSATSSNTFVGYYAGNSTTSGAENTFLGSEAGVNNTLGTGNTFVGAVAGFGTFSGGLGVTGSYNTFIGTRAGLNNRGSNNTFVGAYSGLSNTTGVLNMFIGLNAGASNSTGSRNTYIGNEAAALSTTASQVTAIGPQAGYNNKADNNTFIGLQAGFNNTIGPDNFFIGGFAGCSNTTGGRNLFLGYLAGAKNANSLSAAGEYNTFIGNLAGCKNVSGSYNTFIGAFAGAETSPGARNTMIGQFAGAYTGYPSSTQTISDNTYLGYASGAGVSATLANSNMGVRNTFIGSRTGELKKSGNENVFIGHWSGQGNLTGQRNVFIGAFSGTTSNVSNAIAIGHSAVPTTDNQFVLASNQYPIGTASAGVFSHFLNATINGIDMKIPLYY